MFPASVHAWTWKHATVFGHVIHSHHQHTHRSPIQRVHVCWLDWAGASCRWWRHNDTSDQRDHEVKWSSTTASELVKTYDRCTHFTRPLYIWSGWSWTQPACSEDQTTQIIPLKYDELQHFQRGNCYLQSDSLLVGGVACSHCRCTIGKQAILQMKQVQRPLHLSPT